MREPRTTGWRALAVTAPLLTALLGSGAPALASPAASPAPPAVNWAQCPEDVLKPVPADQRHLFGCASYAVPLDHRRPHGPQIELALLRRAASVPARRIGSLFLNPGGPGGSGFGMPLRGTSTFQPEVLERFDLVGFDPRGVSRSTPLRCFTSEEEAKEVEGALVDVPISRAEISQTMDGYRRYSASCARNAGDLLRHMSTEAVARDLDLLRAAVGDTKLTYVGFSYGTLLGATYVNLFPDRVRAVVLDGNVDPKLRTSDGVEYDRQRAQGFEVALTGYLTACRVAGPKCAFGAGDPRARFDQIRDRLRQGPLALPDDTTLTLSAFTSTVAGSLYKRDKLKPLAESLQRLHEVVQPPAKARDRSTAALSLFRDPTVVSGRYDSPYTGDSSYLGVNCTDKRLPRAPGLVSYLADRWEEESPTFGRYQAFADVAGCSTWPVRAPKAFRGPWNRGTETPVLLLGNRYDPATQYRFSERMAAQLGSARLVTVDGFGHCILGSSTCTDLITAAYLTELKVPAPGQVCVPNAQPF